MDLTRRGVLRKAVAGAVATGIAGESLAKGADRKIVGLRADSGFGVARERADSVHRELDFGDVGKAVAGTFSDRALEALENNPQVRYVEEDGPVRALYQDASWGWDRVDAAVLDLYDETAAGADVAVLDTGIQSDHPDLQANVGAGSDFTGTGSWEDDNGHGTHCAGIVGAVDNSEGVVGVAPEVTLHAGKVLDRNGYGTTSDLAAGIDWVTNNRYDVASMSLGFSSGSSTLKDAVQYAWNMDVFLVAAAGNNSGGSVEYPAAYSEVVAVSSTDENNDLSDFSSTGPAVEIAAPGTDIRSTSTGSSYETLSGTSMACPHVAAVAAHLMADGLANWETRQRLKDTARDLGLPSDEQGAGLVDAREAVAVGAGDVAPKFVSYNASKSDGYDGDYITASWYVADLNGDLAEVTTTVQDSTKTSSATGDKDGGNHVHGPFNYPYSYGVYLTATDEAGNETTVYTSV